MNNVNIFMEDIERRPKAALRVTRDNLNTLRNECTLTLTPGPQKMFPVMIYIGDLWRFYFGDFLEFHFKSGHQAPAGRRPIFMELAE